MSVDKKIKIKTLVEQLNHANKMYYTTGTPIMDDSEYDMLFDELKALELETGYVLDISPTQHPGYYIEKECINKVKHSHSMLSLDKVHSKEEIVCFLNKYNAIASIKLDGLTVSAEYNDGVLTKLETRGDGEIGNDILFHANSFINLPLIINKSGKYIVDGECIITSSDFESINSNLEKKFENQRNLASGTLSLLNTEISSKRFLRFVVWNVIEGADTNSFGNNLLDASELGFTIVPFQEVNKEEDIEYVLKIIKSLSKEYEYPMDGCVFSFDDVQYGLSLGKTDKFFRHSIAYKYEDESVKTHLREIEWSMGTGKLTPVAIFDPVYLCGSTVSRASLHNISIMKKLQLGIGDEISVIKSNMIIPQVKENITKSNNFEIPNCCPICGGKTEIKMEVLSGELICTNPLCDGKLLGKLVRFVSKPCMNIDGLSQETLSKLIDWGWVNSVIDIYDLYKYKNEFIIKDGFGETSVNNLLNSIEISKNCSMKAFINSLNIPMVGKTASKLIAEKCNNDITSFIERLRVRYDWRCIEGIGLKVNLSIQEWYKNNFMFIKELGDIVNIEVEKEVVKNTNSNVSLNGRTFCITGKLNSFENRDALVKDIESNGGKYVNSVTSKTNYLINNDNTSTSSKNKKAKEVGCSIITEEEYKQLVIK